MHRHVTPLLSVVCSSLRRALLFAEMAVSVAAIVGQVAAHVQV